ncbi:MAG: DUF3592 domain-containing protein [Planctomycetes bacterium]|nr:DUF3592 domain-containing protein [Planctomycetota bacterium]
MKPTTETDASTSGPVAAANLPAFGDESPPRRVFSFARPLIPVAAALFIMAAWAFAVEFVVLGGLRLFYPLPTVEAVVTDVEYHTATGEVQKIKYRYCLDGHSYTGSLTQPVKPKTHGLMRGNTVTVEYFPGRPWQSYRHSDTAWTHIIAGFCIATVPLVVLGWSALIGRANRALPEHRVAVERDGDRLHILWQLADKKAHRRVLYALLGMLVSLGTFPLLVLAVAAAAVADKPISGSTVAAVAVALAALVILCVGGAKLQVWLARRRQDKTRTMPRQAFVGLDATTRTLILPPRANSQRSPIDKIAKSPLLPDDYFAVLETQDIATAWPGMVGAARQWRSLLLVRPSEKRYYAVAKPDMGNTDAAVSVARALNAALGCDGPQSVLITRRTWPHLVWPAAGINPLGRGSGNYVMWFFMTAISVVPFAVKFKILPAFARLPALLSGSLGFSDACAVLGKTALFAAPACAALACLVGLLQYLWLRHRWPDVERPEKEVVFSSD